MATRYENIDESSSHDTIYVAVGKVVEESKLTLLWALTNFHGKKFCILHVHQPTLIGRYPDSRIEEHDLKAIQVLERQFMHEILDDYHRICDQVRAEILHIEMDDIGEGILKLKYQHNIKKLVMGAAANKHYSAQMTILKSKKAIYVHQHMPLSCQIWFICSGNLIHSQGADGVNEEVTSPLLEASSITETGQSNPGRSPSPSSSHLTCSSSEVVGDLALIPFERTEERGCGLELCVRPQSGDDTAGILDGSSIDQLYNILEQAMAEAEKLKREASKESVRPVKSEKDAIEAACEARAFESLYTEELRRSKEIQEALERQVATSDHMMKELVSARELLQFLKKERDELQIERDNALEVTKVLLKKQEGEASRSHMNKFFSEFSVTEIEEATRSFEPSLKIREGGYGSIYKGLLHRTQVAIKVLHPSSTSEYQQEVDVLSKLRHPNLVTLIGVCPENWALIYEYLPNGSLEDRLSCKDNTAPLSWQTRIRIATQLCSVLIFLHSGNPQRIVHGGLEPRNILLDENFVCKLSDFGLCCALSLRENSSNMTQCHIIDSEDTFLYLDPQFLETGELSPKSDIYSFGIILLQLLTGRSSPLDIAKEVQDAINEGNLTALLDPSARDWPFVQAEQLAHLALRCCEMDRSDRPDLVLEVWRLLEPMRASCRASSTFHLGTEEHGQPPSFFICPILQEVMQDPHVAADGHTYEAEAITGWLESDHDTSPMTNLKLPHLNLVPNYALRSVIQEWQQLQH